MLLIVYTCLTSCMRLIRLQLNRLADRASNEISDTPGRYCAVVMLQVFTCLWGCMPTSLAELDQLMSAPGPAAVTKLSALLMKAANCQAPLLDFVFDGQHILVVTPSKIASLCMS